MSQYRIAQEVGCRVAVTAALMLLILLMTGGCGVKEQQTLRTAKVLARVDGPVHFEPIKAQEWKLENGLTVFFYRDPELPLIQGSLIMRGGSLWEAQSHRGAVSAMGAQMRSGGAGSYSADELDLELERLAAAISSGFGEEYGNVSFQGLSSDFSVLIGMTADVVLRPRFEPTRLELWKGQAIESIRRRRDDPNTMAGISFAQILYHGTPYNRVLVRKDVESIRRDDLVGMHQQFVRPDEAILVLTGDVTREQVEREVAFSFGAWQARGRALGAAPEIREEPQGGIYFIPGNFAQATIYAGHLGVPRLTEDHYAIEAFNYIFGTGGFSSRLMQTVRSDAGLAYVVYGGIFPGTVKGRNVIMVQTKAESTTKAIDTALGTLSQLQAQSVSADELTEAKRALQNSFVFKFESIAEMVQREATLRMLQYPENYDSVYLESIEGLDVSDIQTTAQRRWRSKDLVVVVVGNESAYTSLKEAVGGASPYLRGMPLRRVKFGDRLEM